MGQRRLQFLLFAVRKFVGLGITFLVVSLLLFLAIRAIPGDPVALRLKSPDPELVARERERLGLDNPLPVQFYRQVQAFWQGDWGRSFGTGRPVVADVRSYLPATLELALAAMILGVVTGAGWAFAAEWSHNRWVSLLSYSVGMVGVTVPIYWVGLLLLIAGSLILGWFPSSGRVDPGTDLPFWSGFLIFDGLIAGRPALVAEALRHLFLPALCLSLYPAAQVCGTLRARLRDERTRALLAALRARGLSPSRIWLLHFVKLLGAPVVASVGTTFGLLLGGAVLTETVFSWPGMGRYLVGAVLDRDIYVIQNALLLVVFVVLVVVQTSDLAAKWLNPSLNESDEA
jgi:ABC-type dipeptide/oligopeptide/nickel transport system permease component